MENFDTQETNHDGKTLANKAAQAEEPLDALSVHKAAEQGDIQKLTSLVHSVEHIDRYDTYGRYTPLHLAIESDHVEAVKILLEAGADPEKLDYSDTAVDPPHPTLDLAAWLGSYRSLRVLIDHGVAVSPSSLALAASLNLTDCMTIIIQELNKDDSLYAAWQGCARIALIQATQCWHTEAVELLLTHVTGFPNLSITDDRSCLTEALFMALSEYYYDNPCRERLHQRSPDKYKELPQRFLFMLQNLVHYGADINATVPETGMTRFWPLTNPMASFNLGSVLCFLLPKGLRVDEDTGEYHPCPIMVALAYIKDIDTIKIMVGAGARVEFTDQKLRKPLHLAQSRAIAEFLCNLGADTSAKDDQGRTALHTACHGVYEDVVDFLISHGSNVNELATGEQWTQLHFATCERHLLTSHIFMPEESWNTATSTSRLQAAKILLKNGANIQVTASNGRTVLHGAVQNGDLDLTRFLLEQGVNVNASAVAGETALHMAIAIIAIQTPTEPQISAMATILLDYGANLEAKKSNWCNTVAEGHQ